jgi:hypothetical protein
MLLQYEHNMPVIIRLVNKFRGFPQTEVAQAFEKTQEGQEVMKRHAPYISKYELGVYEPINEQENHFEKSPSPNYAPSTGTLMNDTPRTIHGARFLTSPEGPLTDHVPDMVSNISDWTPSPLNNKFLGSRGYTNRSSKLSVVATPVKLDSPSNQASRESDQSKVHYSRASDMDTPTTKGPQTPYDVNTPKSGGATDHFPEDSFVKPPTARMSGSSVAPFSPLDKASVKGRPGTPFPFNEGTESGSKKRGRPCGSSSKSTSHSSSIRRRNKKTQNKPDASYKPNNDEWSDDEMDTAPRKKRVKRTTETRGKNRGGRASGAVDAAFQE